MVLRVGGQKGFRKTEPWGRRTAHWTLKPEEAGRESLWWLYNRDNFAGQGPHPYLTSAALSSLWTLDSQPRSWALSGGHQGWADTLMAMIRDQTSYSQVQISVEHIIPDTIWGTFELYISSKKKLLLLIWNSILIKHLYFVCYMRKLWIVITAAACYYMLVSSMLVTGTSFTCLALSFYQLWEGYTTIPVYMQKILLTLRS